MIQLTDKIYAAEIPIGAIGWQISIDPDGIINFYDKSDTMFSRIHIGPGDWEIIGLASEITEEQARSVMEHRCANSCSWPRCTSLDCMYKDGEAWEMSNLQSFRSLMQSKGLVYWNTVGGTEPGCLGKPYCCEGKRCKALLWQDAEDARKNVILLRRK